MPLVIKINKVLINKKNLQYNIEFRYDKCNNNKPINIYDIYQILKYHIGFLKIDTKLKLKPS